MSPPGTGARYPALLPTNFGAATALISVGASLPSSAVVHGFGTPGPSRVTGAAAVVGDSKYGESSTVGRAGSGTAAGGTVRIDAVIRRAPPVDATGAAATTGPRASSSSSLPTGAGPVAPISMPPLYTPLAPGAVNTGTAPGT